MLAFNGMDVHVIDAQKQARTPLEKGPWVRPKVPSKRRGRKGTRRAWKRKHPPHQVWRYSEPLDVLIVANKTLVITPRQAEALRHAVPKQYAPDPFWEK